jgi:hypothetical protein
MKSLFTLTVESVEDLAAAINGGLFVAFEKCEREIVGDVIGERKKRLFLFFNSDIESILH